MGKFFTLKYWIDEDWYVGRLREVPGVFSQGESLAELQDNIKDAYRVMMEQDESEIAGAQIKELEIEM